MISRIQQRFEQIQQSGRKALVAYITLGDPDLTTSSKIIVELAKAGADVIELGVPFSDPLADGPVIQRATERALKSGFTVAAGLKLISALRAEVEAPFVLFSYYNPLYAYGLRPLTEHAKAAGIDGVLITDLSVEEAREPVSVLQKGFLDRIFLVAPTSTDERIRKIADLCSGFIYAVSRTGVTGEQPSISAEVTPLLQRIRRYSDLPIAVGFGISTPDQVAEVCEHADAAVVGSAIVRCVEDNLGDPHLPQKVGEFARWLRGGI